MSTNPNEQSHDKHDETGNHTEATAHRLNEKERSSMLRKFKERGLTEQQIDEYMETFTMFDKNNDGLITAKELESMLNSLGQKVSTSDVILMIKKIDKNDDGAIDFGEFVEMMIVYRAKLSNNSDRDNELRQAFRVFDTDNSGKISAKKLKEAMKKLGQTITDDEAAEMIRIADKDGDGEINYEEFSSLVKLIEKPKSME